MKYTPSRKQQSQIRGKFQPRQPRSKKTEQEFGPGKKDVFLCRNCPVVYWYKSWHHRLQDYPQLEERKGIRFTICPACRMIKDKKYEGEIILENMPQSLKSGIRKLANSYGKRAQEEDPQDRIISIGEDRILTTENQLAQRLAKKIKQSFGGKIYISHSHGEDVIRVKIKFPNYYYGSKR